VRNSLFGLKNLKAAALRYSCTWFQWWGISHLGQAGKFTVNGL
jgi:hypothetical protein